MDTLKMDILKLAVTGASGRMGRELIRAIVLNPSLQLVGALEREGSEYIGRDAGELAGLGKQSITVTSDVTQAFADAQGIIDFSAPSATRVFAKWAHDHGIIHVVGTTGLSPEDMEALKTASQKAVIIQSGNMSLGVNLLAALIEKAAHTLGNEFDIEVLEMHHRHKVDAPSGTALLLGNAAAKGRKVTLDEKAVRSRDGHTGARREGDIGFATLRGGTVIGDHSVIFAGPCERIVLTHVAEDRAIFAHGALKAAQWGSAQKAGLYSMRDVLGLD
jgi:4-hydroxy-tetrahydrodipicolinate reductase